MTYMKHSILNQAFPGVSPTAKVYMTELADCPYLEGRKERKACVRLLSANAQRDHDALNLYGFRRSENIVYRPACPNCNLCKSSRINVNKFYPSRTHKRILRLNQDIRCVIKPPVVNTEQFNLFKSYLNSRHNESSMTTMKINEFSKMVKNNRIRNNIFEYRINLENKKSKLIACSVSDIMHDGLSMIYTFFDSDYQSRSLGTYMILNQINQTKAMGLPHIYLGYWIKDSPKMDYKRNFSGFEILDGIHWRGLEDQE